MPPLITFSGCTNCSLKKDWPFLLHPKMLIIPPSEESPYRVLILGEAPGAEEDFQGKPFLGKAGKLLREHIPNGWERKVYWGNIVRCRPTKDGHKSNRAPELHEIGCCSTYLHQDLAKIKPHAILVLGDVALKSFWEGGWITGIRGLPFPTKLADGFTTWVYGTFHPSYVMRQSREDFDTHQLSNSYVPIFKNDLKNFFEQVPWFASNSPVTYEPPKKEEILYPKTPDEALSLFYKLEEPFAADIETLQFRPYLRDARILTAAFSDGKTTFSFPVRWPQQSWGEEVFAKMMTSGRHWIAQSAGMEYSWTWYLTKKREQHFEDTEVLARLNHKRKGVGKLSVLSRLYLGFDIKKLLGFDSGDLLQHLKYPLETVLYYNALDSWSEKLIYDILLPKMSANDLDNYGRIIAAIKSTVAMELRGLEVDLGTSEELQKKFLGKMNEIENKAKDIAEVKQFENERKQFFRLSEAKTVGNVLVEYCGIDLPKTPKDQQYSTDEKDLEQYAGKHQLVDTLLDFRGVQKLLTTYIDPILSGSLFGIDGLLHPRYTVVHTATFRLSSEFPNIQNWPKRSNKEIRNQIIAPKGHILAAFDYGQLEGRVIAMFSRDKNLIKSFIEKEDIHWKWLYRIIELYPAYLERLARISGETKEDNVLKAGRTIIKTDFVFASFYGAKPGSLSNRTGIPIDIAEQVWWEFWRLYPDAKNWVDSQFRLYQQSGYVQSLNGRVRNEVLPGNEPCNSPSQGSASEIVLEAQNSLSEKAFSEDMYFLPRIQIHDDIVFILPDTDDSKLEWYIKEIGSEIVKPRFDFIIVPLMTECRIGYGWADISPITTFEGEYYK